MDRAALADDAIVGEQTACVRNEEVLTKTGPNRLFWTDYVTLAFPKSGSGEKRANGAENVF